MIVNYNSDPIKFYSMKTGSEYEYKEKEHEGDSDDSTFFRFGCDYSSSSVDESFQGVIHTYWHYQGDDRSLDDIKSDTHIDDCKPNHVSLL